MLYLIFSALIVLIDQAVKYVITSRLAEGGVHALIPGIVHLTHIQNTGAAFSMLSNMRWVLVAVSAVCSVLLIILVLRFKKPWICRLCLAAILGGAVGNLIDRFLFGSVTDMFEVEFMKFAVFNVADICITGGAVLFCLCYLVYGIVQAAKKRSHPEEAAPSREHHREHSEHREERHEHHEHRERHEHREERHEHHEHRERHEHREEHHPRRRESAVPDFKENTVDLSPGVPEEAHFSEEQILQEYDIQRMLEQADLDDDLNNR